MSYVKTTLLALLLSLPLQAIPGIDTFRKNPIKTTALTTVALGTALVAQAKLKHTNKTISFGKHLRGMILDAKNNPTKNPLFTATVAAFVVAGGSLAALVTKDVVTTYQTGKKNISPQKTDSALENTVIQFFENDPKHNQLKREFLKKEIELLEQNYTANEIQIKKIKDELKALENIGRRENNDAILEKYFKTFLELKTNILNNDLFTPEHKTKLMSDLVEESHNDLLRNPEHDAFENILSDFESGFKKLARKPENQVALESHKDKQAKNKELNEQQFLACFKIDLEEKIALNKIYSEEEDEHNKMSQAFRIKMNKLFNQLGEPEQQAILLSDKQKRKTQEAEEQAKQENEQILEQVREAEFEAQKAEREAEELEMYGKLGLDRQAKNEFHQAKERAIREAAYADHGRLEEAKERIIEELQKTTTIDVHRLSENYN